MFTASSLKLRRANARRPLTHSGDVAGRDGTNVGLGGRTTTEQLQDLWRWYWGGELLEAAAGGGGGVLLTSM